MDPRERTYDPLVAQRALLQGHQATIWTAMPAILQSYDPAKKTCSAQVAVMSQVQDRKTGAWNNVKITVCVDCPVIFPGGGGFTLTFPLKSGDEGLLVFASRCIDAWWQNGGVQPQAEVRLHDLSDGLFIPGASSVPNVPANTSATNVQLRNADGTLVIELSDADKSCKITAPGGVTIIGPVQIQGALAVTETITWPHGVIGGAGAAVQINGDLSATGAVHSDAQVTSSGNVVAGQGGADQIGLSSHTHPAPGGSTGAPTAGT